MIVKNEEAVLARCLDSLKGIAEEIVIVDTGSTDRTKEIAARYTDKIYDFTYGHLRKSLVLMKDNTCIYSGIMVSSLINRWKNINQIETKDNIDNMLYVGKDNYVNINDIYMMSGNVKSKPLVSKIKIAKENMNFIDFTGGDKMRSILFMKDGTIIVTSLDDRTLLERLKNIIIL
jgi:glycosyltransferase involved in cell wall biosynthesis